MNRSLSLIKKINEGKNDYTLYHNSLTSAVQEVEKYIEKQGYTYDDEDMAQEVGLGPKKPSEGKTNSYHLPLYRNGKKVRQYAHFQVYNRGNKIGNNMELNVYIS